MHKGQKVFPLERVEICAGCGAVAKEATDSFKCAKCGSEVSVVVSAEIFRQMVDAGVARA